MNNSELLAKLADIFPDHAHVISQDRLSLDAWLRLGQPHSWSRMETKLVKGKAVRVWVDTGYGILLVVGRDGELHHGKNEVTHKDWVVLDTDYYGLPKYIWI